MKNDLPIIYGVKCYPCCNWEQNQHKIYNAHYKAMNALDDAMENHLDDEDWEAYEKLEQWAMKVDEVLSMFNNHIVGNWVYLPYPQYKIAKEIIARY